LRTGVSAGDALLGDLATISGDFERDPAGVLIMNQLTVAGAAASLSGNARFDPASNRLVAALALELPRLKPLGPALGAEMAGAVSAHVDAEGALDHLGIKGNIAGNDIVAGQARIARLRLAGEVLDLLEPKATVDGSYRTNGVDGTVALDGPTGTEFRGGIAALSPDGGRRRDRG
jgi:autotransporter translocation and assembly factor TamB